MTAYVALSMPIFFGLLAILVGRAHLARLRKINAEVATASSNPAPGSGPSSQRPNFRSDPTMEGSWDEVALNSTFWDKIRVFSDAPSGDTVSYFIMSESSRREAQEVLTKLRAQEALYRQKDYEAEKKKFLAEIRESMADALRITRERNRTLPDTAVDQETIPAKK
jgi:hypothetical protein